MKSSIQSTGLILLLSICCLMQVASVGCAQKTSVFEARYWLDSHNSPHRIDVTGRWSSDEFGWGQLTQKGKDVTGYLGDYTIIGVTSGTDLYLAFVYDESVYYFVHMKPGGKNLLTGYYSDTPLIGYSERSPITLRK